MAIDKQAKQQEIAGFSYLRSCTFFNNPKKVAGATRTIEG
jgi:hypothetical protein